ncbi:putative TonB-dependent receptor [Sterolibacterium denitrificans]|uniref:TonB-dependent receptor n=1 Tax=Sterolibacterium denitrificans TaxID=157592 RepID=A0A7Z7MUK2_9PROT|nr:TonB-dependent receptor [Sterolibacterium denitrificans]SMB21549.1 putative TonB-dependent receptor [Sterolibacterium denitrificans]
MKPNFPRKPIALTLSVALAQLVAVPLVHAQEQGQAKADSAAIEEVVVTAQKRKENLQDVPISIQALGAKDLEKHNIVALGDIGAEVPGLNLAPYPGSSEAFFPFFRGITTNAVFISSPNPIAVHMDGVYFSQLFGLSNPAADLERIEVLKGPQGVLSGRNATGGAVNIHTARPELGLEHIGFKQMFSFANRGQFISKSILTLPVNDDLAMKISYLHNEKDHDGVHNSAPGGVKFGEKKGDAWRFDVRWKPASNVMVDYGYDHTDSKSYDTPPQCLIPGYMQAYSTYNPADPAESWLAFAALTDPRAAQLIAGCSMDKLDQLYVSSPFGKNRNKTETHTLNVAWDVSPSLTIKSITGYRTVDALNHYNYGAYAGGDDARSDSYPLTVNLSGGGTLQLGQPITLYNRSWSQEFQFLGDISQDLKYTSGVYYSSEKGHQHSGPNIAQYVPGAGFDSTFTPTGNDLLILDQKGLSSAESTSWAVFAQATWTPNILDKKLDVVPGLRYTRDHRKVVGYNMGFVNAYDVTPGLVPGTVDEQDTAIIGAGFNNVVGDRSWSKMTPALSFNYRWQQNLMTYLKYSTAYTSGGFDPVAGPGDATKFAAGFNPETIKSIEAGMKGEFLDRRLRTNLAIFQSKYKDEQKSVNNGLGGWATVNVGGSTYRGLEFDLTAAITRDLRLGFSYARLHHRYDRWVENNVDVTNLRKLIVPKNDYTMNLDYRFPDFGLPGKLDANLNYTHRDSQSTPLNLSIPTVALRSTTPAFGIWNARIALSQIKAGPGDEGRVTVGLWGKNLANKKYLTMTNPGWVTDMSGNWGDPRSVGLDLTYVY